MYVNTEYDHDSISMEPFLQWIPHQSQNWLTAYAPYVKHILYAFAEIVVSIQGNLVHRTRWTGLLDPHLPIWIRFAPFLFIVRIGSYFIFQGMSGIATAAMTLCFAGYFFAYLAHLNHAFDGNGNPNFMRHQLNAQPQTPTSVA